MAISRVDYFGTTLINLTSDTVSASNLQDGITAHDKAGNPIVGTLKVQNYRTGYSEPNDSLGVDGDLYLVLEG